MKSLGRSLGTNFKNAGGMKKCLQFIILISLFLSVGVKESECQEFSLVGTWKIVEVDSCARGVYPGAEVKKYKMNNVNGILSFNANGQGSIESNAQILCKYKNFSWVEKTDTLMISVLPGKIEGNSCQKIHFLNHLTVEIEKIRGCSRFGLGIWYDVKLEKKE
ncbi:MAG: hypothetical protein NT040_06465 [Bacteroidetes bacterium]|nr:hypothetical protein [Bacteroidota bacterium]